MNRSLDADRAFMDALQSFIASAEPADGSLFARDSVFWRVNREAVLFLGGLRALLLQLAHPKVAQAVADHSRYHHDPLGRARRTFDAVHSMVFDSPAAAIAAARRVYAIHRHVRGQLSDAVPVVDTPQYAATDPRLLQWVQATLVDSALQTYELVFGPLQPLEREHYYQDSRRAGVLFGIDPGTLPPDWTAFQHWFAHYLASGEITVTPTAKVEAQALLQGSWPARLARPLTVSLVAGMLPAELRVAYGLPWGRREQLIYVGVLRTARLVVRCVPASMRAVPAARRAERRGATR